MSPFYYHQTTPSHMWEGGLHVGMASILGDVEADPGIASGIHVRRALDYVFSIRGDLMLGKMRNSDLVDGRTVTYWNSGTIDLIASLNNLNWSQNKVRKTNFYGFLSAGLNRFRVAVIEAITPATQPKAFNVQSHGGLGLGFSYRLSERFNLGIESKAYIMFGKENDRLDAVQRQDGDVLTYTSLRLNYNIGNYKKKSEPLYWVNPMNAIQNSISELKKRPVFDLTDTDGDGVIDLLDQDNETPPYVDVDIRGLPLDSDDDGIPNHEDEEPFKPSDKEGNAYGESYATETEIERMIRDRLYEYNATGIVPQPGMEGKGGTSDEDELLASTAKAKRPNLNQLDKMTNWFLPLIHFDIDSYRLRYIDIEPLTGIANLMRTNPNLYLVVVGYTDNTSSDHYNTFLSYKRAEAAINYLVDEQSIDRDRLLLQYGGENSPLVPSADGNLMNRRVEFRVATSEDEEMPPPPAPTEKPKNKRKGF